MSGPASTLVADLRRRGAELRVAGDRLQVVARPGVVNEQDRAALSAAKPQVLQHLTLESRLLGMSLEEFEQAGWAMELRVPWLDVTLWWVPRAEHVAELVRAGIARGRVYTAQDLTNLTRLTENAEGRADIERIAKLKLAFDATILSIGDDTQPFLGKPQPAREACFACRGRRFWLSIYGVRVCARCHPPGRPDLVAEWIGDDTEASR